MNTYKTLLEKGTDTYIVNKSRFLCHACPVKTEEEALAFLSEIRSKHKDATHNCYAYIVGKNSGIMRYSDDGEPQGTAGMPIIEVMKKQEVVDACVVITRYFGGVLLGAGGLVRAYATSSKLALQKAQIVCMIETENWMFDVPYTLFDKVKNTLSNMPVIIVDSAFDTTVLLTLKIKQKDVQSVIDTLTQLSNARIEGILIDSYFAPWQVDVQED